MRERVYIKPLLQGEAGPLPKKDVNLLENDIFDPLAEENQKPDPPLPPPPPTTQAWMAQIGFYYRATHSVRQKPSVDLVWSVLAAGALLL